MKFVEITNFVPSNVKTFQKCFISTKKNSKHENKIEINCGFNGLVFHFVWHR